MSVVSYIEAYCLAIYLASENFKQLNTVAGNSGDPTEIERSSHLPEKIHQLENQDDAEDDATRE